MQPIHTAHAFCFKSKAEDERRHIRSLSCRSFNNTLKQQQQPASTSCSYICTSQTEVRSLIYKNRPLTYLHFSQKLVILVCLLQSDCMLLMYKYDFVVYLDTVNNKELINLI